MKIKLKTKVPIRGKTEEEKPEKSEKRSVRDEIKSAEERLVADCKEVLSKGIREYMAGVEKRLMQAVEDSIGVNFDKEVAKSIKRLVHEAYTVTQLSYDTPLKEIKKLSEEGWKILDIVTPAVAKHMTGLKAGFIMQKPKGASSPLEKKAAREEKEDAEPSASEPEKKDTKPVRKFKIKVRK